MNPKHLHDELKIATVFRLFQTHFLVNKISQLTCTFFPVLVLSTKQKSRIPMKGGKTLCWHIGVTLKNY